MSMEEMILEKLRGLPPEKQQEVLDFTQFLEHKSAPSHPLRSLKGLWADLGVQITKTISLRSGARCGAAFRKVDDHDRNHQGPILAWTNRAA